MTKTSVTIPKTIMKRIFTAADAKSEGISRYQIELLLGQGSIERLGRGVYRKNGGDVPQEEWFRVATLWVGEPSAICLISALAYYNLTDEIPKQTWIMVPQAKLSRHKGLRLVRLRSPHWNLGIEKHDKFWITSVTRTVVDSFLHSRIVGNQIAISALKTSIEEELTTVRAVYEMALKLGVGKRLLPYVELMS